MKKTIVYFGMFVLLLSLTTTTTALAQQDRQYKLEDMPKVESYTPKLELSENEYQLWLNKENTAPYDGILLSPEAIAHILVDYLDQQERGKIVLEKQRELDLSLLNLETGKLQVTAQSEQKKNNVRFDSQEKEIERLQSINKDIREHNSSFWRDALLVGGGIGIGALAGIIVGLVAAN
jgi:tetrahydromethanopterin S-methyltransferase subunit F